MKKLLAIVLSVFFAFGVLAGCNNDTPSGKVKELEELKGRVVYSIGKGNVPDLVFRYILKKAGIEYVVNSTEVVDGKVSLGYVSEGTEFIGGLKAETMHYGVISEPAATQATKNVDGATKMFDIQELYNEISGSNSGYPQAALVVKKSFLDAHPGYVKDFVAAFKQDAKWAETNPADALTAIKNAGSTTLPLLNAEIAKGCNLGFTSAAVAKNELLDFYKALNEVVITEQKEVGVAKMPEDEFFKGEIAGESESGVTAHIYAPYGAPAIGMAKLIADGFAGANFHIVPPANIMESVVNGKDGNPAADIAIMPTNAAAIRYAADKSIVMLGVTNWGSLYLVGA